MMITCEHNGTNGKMIMKNEIIKDLIFIPQRFYEHGNVSFYSLLRSLRYESLYNKINVFDIIPVLLKDQSCINDWLSWSKNKRTENGWYFKKHAENNYSVGYISSSGKSEILSFDNKVTACATFIKKEADNVISK